MSRYDSWKAREPEPCTEDAREQGCTCGFSRVHPTDIDPPEPRISRDCPLHGDDPDDAYERMRDEGGLEPDTADDYRDDL